MTSPRPPFADLATVARPRPSWRDPARDVPEARREVLVSAGGVVAIGFWTGTPGVWVVGPASTGPPDGWMPLPAPVRRFDA